MVEFNLSVGLTDALPSINDIAPSWADIAITASITGGQLLTMADIAGIKWSRKVEVGVQRGASGGRIMKRTTGQIDYECSAVIYRSGVRKLKRALVSLAPTRGRQAMISLVAFDIMVQHTPPGETDIYQTKIKGCRFLGDDDDNKEGPDADKVTVTLNTISIVDIIDGNEVVLL
jgi:hypothetical protein